MSMTHYYFSIKDGDSLQLVLKLRGGPLSSGRCGVLLMVELAPIHRTGYDDEDEYGQYLGFDLPAVDAAALCVARDLLSPFSLRRAGRRRT